MVSMDGRFSMVLGGGRGMIVVGVGSEVGRLEEGEDGGGLW